MTTELPELKTGDKVIITSRRYNETSAQGPYEIERETKTLLIVNGRRFRKRDHTEHAARDPWHPSPKIIPADSHEAKILIREARIKRARGLFHESVNRPNRDATELEAALTSRRLLDVYIRQLSKDQQ